MRRGGRAVEGSGLENRQTFTRLVGSKPTLFAMRVRDCREGSLAEALMSSALAAFAKAAQKFADRGDRLLAQPGLLFLVVWRGEE